MKILRGISLCIALFLAGVSHADEGKWNANKEFAQFNLACYRVYTCWPEGSQMIRGDQKIVATENQIVWGVCSADGGAVDSCNRCLTSKPKVACTWMVEDK